MNTLDTENRGNSTSFGSGTNIYGDIDTLIREMFSYWDRIKESNPGSVASNDVKDPITMVKDYADSLLSSRDTYWMERMRKEFGEFAHEHYLGCHTDEVGKWHYSYDNEVVYLVDAYLEKITNEYNLK